MNPREYRLRARIDKLADENAELRERCAELQSRVTRTRIALHAARASRDMWRVRWRNERDSITRLPKRTRRTTECPQCGGPKMTTSRICQRCNGLIQSERFRTDGRSA